jgi:hypothetical protein
MRSPHEPKATDGAKRNKGVVVARFDDGSVPIHDRPRRAEVIGVVVPAVQIRGVAADHAPVRRQEVGKPDAPARDDADRRRSVKKIMLGRLAADLLVGALPGGRVAVVGHMPLTGFELRGQVAFIVDQAREVVGLRVEGCDVAVCVVGDGPGRGRGGIPPGKTPAVADRTVEGALFVEGGGVEKGIPVLRTDRLAGGVHLLRITAEDFTATERVTVVR